MGASGYAEVICGVELNFELFEYDLKLRRFDLKSGEPKEVISPAFRLVSTLLCPSGRNVEQVLPEDEKIFAEDVDQPSNRLYRPEPIAWASDRVSRRQADWFATMGITDESRIQAYGPHYMWGRRVVGAKIADGHSYYYGNENEDDTRIVSFQVPEPQQIAAALKDILSPAFGEGPYKPQLFLITNCG